MAREVKTSDTKAETSSAKAAEREPKRRPRLALIAHDGKKADMIAFATFNRGTLQRCRLAATSTTGRLLREEVGLTVEGLPAGHHLHHRTSRPREGGAHRRGPAVRPGRR